MSPSSILTFVSTLAFAIQLLIFAYLYSSHRVRFFHYLLWAWGAYTLSKGIKLLDVLTPGVPLLGLAIDVATVAAVGLTLAAALAQRWDYRLTMRDLVLGGGLSVLIAAVNAQVAGATLLATVVRWLVLTVAGAVALTEVGVAREMVLLVFGIAFGGAVLALSLAFGLGAR